MARNERRTAAKVVDVVCISGDLPFVAQGCIATASGTTYVVDADRDAGAVEPGARVILNFLDDDLPRVVGRVQSVRGNRIECVFEHTREKERREFPRLVAGLPVRFRVVAGAEAVREISAWLGGSPEPLARGDWHVPDEFMNFSVTGLRFECAPVCAEGDLLLVEFGIRGRAERWRATARVIRAIPVAEEDLEDAGSPMVRVAVGFEQIPAEAQNALSEMTLDIQEALL